MTTVYQWSITLRKQCPNGIVNSKAKSLKHFPNSVCYFPSGKPPTGKCVENWKVFHTHTHTLTTNPLSGDEKVAAASVSDGHKFHSGEYNIHTLCVFPTPFFLRLSCQGEERERKTWHQWYVKRLRSQRISFWWGVGGFCYWNWCWGDILRALESVKLCFLHNYAHLVRKCSLELYLIIYSALFCIWK